MRNIIIILTVNLFFLSCIDIIKSSNEEFYESVHIKGGGWFKFYEELEIPNLNLTNDFTLQTWFSGQEQTDDEAACIASLIGDASNIAMYRNPNVNNIIMIYENGELIREMEFDNIDFSKKENFYLLSIIKIQDQIIIYINDTSIKEPESIENGNWDWIDLNNNNLYDNGEYENFIDYGSDGCPDNQESGYVYLLDANGNLTEQQDIPNSYKCLDEEELCQINAINDLDGDGQCDLDPNGDNWVEGLDLLIYTQNNQLYELGEPFVDTGIPLIIENQDILQPIIGANLQSNNNPAPENLWYGYIDEIRLWDEALTDTVIKFHNQYPTKLSDAYFDDDDILNAHLPSLNGLWDFRIEISESSIDNVFHDIENQLRYIVLYTLGSMSNELSELSR